MESIKERIARLILCSLICTPVYAGDSSSPLANPSINLLTITDGEACARNGEIAQTQSGTIASCVSGVWQGRSLSNPVTVNAVSPFLVGFGGIAAFAACPAGKKAVGSSCWVWAVTSSAQGPGDGWGFIHDEDEISGGINGFGFPIAGDSGVYCLYVAEAGSSGYVIPTAICVDR